MIKTLRLKTRGYSILKTGQICTCRSAYDKHFPSLVILVKFLFSGLQAGFSLKENDIHYFMFVKVGEKIYNNFILILFKHIFHGYYKLINGMPLNGFKKICNTYFEIICYM